MIYGSPRGPSPTRLEEIPWHHGRRRRPGAGRWPAGQRERASLSYSVRTLLARQAQSSSSTDARPPGDTAAAALDLRPGDHHAVECCHGVRMNSHRHSFSPRPCWVIPYRGRLINRWTWKGFEPSVFEPDQGPTSHNAATKIGSEPDWHALHADLTALKGNSMVHRQAFALRYASSHDQSSKPSKCRRHNLDDMHTSQF